MNKSLDEILVELHSIPSDPRVVEAKSDIRLLILETFGDALVESKSVEEMGEKFRQKVMDL